MTGRAAKRKKTGGKLADHKQPGPELPILRQPPEGWVGLNDFAAAAGVSPIAITGAKQTGQIAPDQMVWVDFDGKYDKQPRLYLSKDSFRSYILGIDRSKLNTTKITELFGSDMFHLAPVKPPAAAKKLGGRPKGSKNSSSGPGMTKRSFSSLNDAKLAKIEGDIYKNDLETRELLNTSIPIEVVKQVMLQAAITTRQRLYAMIAKLESVLAVINTSHDIGLKLKKEIDIALVDLTDLENYNGS